MHNATLALYWRLCLCKNYNPATPVGTQNSKTGVEYNPNSMMSGVLVFQIQACPLQGYPRNTMADNSLLKTKKRMCFMQEDVLMLLPYQLINSPIEQDKFTKPSGSAAHSESVITVGYTMGTHT